MVSEIMVGSLYDYQHPTRSANITRSRRMQNLIYQNALEEIRIIKAFNYH